MVIFSQSTPCQRELSFPTVKVNKEIEDLSLEPPEPQLSSLVTPKMVRKPELDFHQELERLLSVPAELWSVSAPVDKEQISHSLRQPTPGTRQRERERTGQSLEVLQ